jgi:hypothetical protein
VQDVIYTCLLSSGRAGHKYSYCPERRVLQRTIKDRRSRWSLDVIQDHLGHVKETLSQSGSDKLSGCLGIEDESVFPVVLTDKGISELSADKEDDTNDAENEARTKNVAKCTPLHSEKQDIVNGSCDKIHSFGSQSISSSNKNSKESTEHLVTPQQFGRNKVTCSHCNTDTDSHGFEINRKGRKEMLHSSVELDDKNEEITDDDNDDIFYYRCSQHSSLHYEKENKTINKTFSLNSQSKPVRNAVDNNISRPSVTREYGRNVRNGSCHSATQTHDGANTKKENVIMTRTKRRKPLNYSAGSGYAESRDYKTGNNGNLTKQNVITQRKATRETYNFPGSCYARYDGENLKKVNVFTRERSSNASSNLIGPRHGENVDTRADDSSSFIFSDSCDDGDMLEKEYITPIWKHGRKSSNYLFSSDCDKNEDVVADSIKNPNNGNVLTRRGRRRKTDALYSSGVQEQDENEDYIIDDDSKRGVFHKRKGRRNTDCLISSDVDENKGGVTDVDKMPNRTNVITSRKRQAISLNSSVESKQDETEYNRLCGGSHIRRENVSCRRKARNSSSHLIASDNGKNENEMIDDGECPNSENHLTRSKRGMKVRNNYVSSKNNENDGDITNSRRDSNNSSVLNRRERGTATPRHLIDSERNRNEDIMDKRVLFSDDGNDSKKENIFNRRGRTGITKHHENHDDDDDDDSDDYLFYKTPEHSRFNESEKTANTYGTRNSSRCKARADVTSSHSQMLSTRSNITRKPRQYSVKPVIFKNEDEVNNILSSDETSTGIEDLFTESCRKQFPNDDKSDSTICKMNTMRTKMQRDQSFTSKHPENDSIFYQTPKHSRLSENGKRANACGNRNSTLLESSGSNTHAGVTSSRSQMLSTRSNITRKPRQCSVKPVIFKNEDEVNNILSSDETSTGIEDLFTESCRRQISGNVAKQFPNDDKSDSTICKMNTMRTKMQRDQSFTSKHPENEDERMEHDDDDDDDIFSWFYEKEKNR